MANFYKEKLKIISKKYGIGLRVSQFIFHQCIKDGMLDCDKAIAKMLPRIRDNEKQIADLQKKVDNYKNAVRAFIDNPKVFDEINSLPKR